MKLVRFQFEGRVRAGIVWGERIYPIPGARSLRPLLAMGPRARSRAVDAAAGQQGLTPHEVKLLCPLPDAPKVLALAGNYYVEGAPRDVDKSVATPYFFAKLTDGILGPDDAILLPAFARDCIQEIELGVVIGRECRDVPVGQALAYVAGYTVVNDVSARALAHPAQRRNPSSDEWFDWLNGKWFDGFCVIGPCVVTADEIPAVQELEIVTRVNGKVRLTGNTRDMIFTVPECISYISRFTTLRPGDVIATGVVLGKGEEEVFLKPGDIVEGEIPPIGVLRNHVVATA